MSGRLLANCIRSRIHISKRASHHLAPGLRVDIGTREIVGFGYNGEAAYIDRTDFPMPAIRWKNNTPDVLALREKEKGDWRKLSVEEKKALYRASFCQTFAEIEAKPGELKGCLGVALIFVSMSIWYYMYLKYNVYDPLPVTFEEEYQLAQLDRMKKLDVNPITGLCARK